MRITKRVFLDLTIFMIGFGVVVGLIFPIFSNIIGIPKEYLDTLFIISSIFAGIIVGLVNIILARVIVGKRLNILSERMQFINSNLHDRENFNNAECLDRCMIVVDTNDVIGETSKSFNQLVTSFLAVLKNEESIRNFTEIFTNELDIDILSEKALFHMIQYTEAKAGMVLIDKGGVIDIASSYLIKNPEKVIDLEIVHKSFSSNKQTVFDFTEDIKIEAGLLDFYPKSILIEPISYKNVVLGVILLASTNTFKSEVLENLKVYTHGLSLGLNNAIIHDTLEQLAILDPLTKVYNRRFGMDRFQEEFSRAVRSKAPIGVLMFDLDHFKKVNDTYGHIVGDKVLISFTEIVNDNLRKEDILIRYGGEEFLAILPNATVHGLSKVSDKIRRLIEESIVRYKNQEIKVTVSIGGTSFPEFNGESIEDIVKEADKHLYEAKNTGRNKTICK